MKFFEFGESVKVQINESAERNPDDAIILQELNAIDTEHYWFLKNAGCSEEMIFESLFPYYAEGDQGESQNLNLANATKQDLLQELRCRCDDQLPSLKRLTREDLIVLCRKLG